MTPLHPSDPLSLMTTPRRAPRQLSPKVHTLFKRVIAQITTHPETYNQGTGDAPDLNDCETPSCLIGWALCFAGAKAIRLSRLNDSATDDLPSVIRRQALLTTHGIPMVASSRIYWADQWPERFQTAYAAAKTDRERASVAARRVRAWLDSDGTE